MEKNGFKFNLYEPCVANNIIEEDSLTVVFYVDDVKEILKDTNVVHNFEQCIYFMYGDPNIEKVKSARRKVHEYLYTT